MDDIVKQAMAKWPNVPDCYGWLGLDARGNWYMRDDQAQALGRFGSGIAGSKGSELRHGKLIDFIARNYAADARGCWYFQNGPQRVFVELQAAPLVWRLQPDGAVQDHMGRSAQVKHCWLDESGHLYLEADIGFGLVHTQDIGQAALAVEQGQWRPKDVLRAELEPQFGFTKSPELLHK
ncbi:MAG: DUF2946 family protein [Rhodoferax sp.]|uniref:DUF2946 family protein n=1 Tax=Rhodoferax sp. TaxID=50421 RepID=UPI00261EF6E8|nr:DUF2946 family protein [Rhodoferax sp.]MDD2882762.1 DUF2946 family protein [Rhodoferax sp.]